MTRIKKLPQYYDDVGGSVDAEDVTREVTYKGDWYMEKILKSVYNFVNDNGIDSSYKLNNGYDVKDGFLIVCLYDDSTDNDSYILKIDLKKDEITEQWTYSQLISFGYSEAPNKILKFEDYFLIMFPNSIWKYNLNSANEIESEEEVVDGATDYSNDGNLGGGDFGSMFKVPGKDKILISYDNNANGYSSIIEADLSLNIEREQEILSDVAENVEPWGISYFNEAIYLINGNEDSDGDNNILKYKYSDLSYQDKRKFTSVINKEKFDDILIQSQEDILFFEMSGYSNGGYFMSAESKDIVIKKIKPPRF